MEDKKYYGILMERILITDGTYLFKPMCLMDGEIVNEQIFVDFATKQAFYISSQGDSLLHDSNCSVGYIISEEDLLSLYPENKIDTAKLAYYEKICSKAHIGFYSPDKNIIEIVEYDFQNIYNENNTNEDDYSLDLGEAITSMLPDAGDLVAFPVKDLEDILKKDSLEEMKNELTKIYNDIVGLRSHIDSNVDISNNSSKAIVTGEDIIELFVQSYDVLLGIDDIDNLKDLLKGVYDMYNELYRELDTNNKCDNIEAARDFLIVLIETYSKMLNMNNLDEIKKEIEKIKASEEERILEIAAIYDQKNKIQGNAGKVISKEETLEKTNETMTSLLEQLNSLIGLSNIKEMVEAFIIYLDYINRTREIQNLETPNLNMVFKGNPGTGKTTIARIMAKLLYHLGYVKENKFVEITAQDLIAGYVGQTAIKTRKVLDQNKGGVIFLDEAYALCSQNETFADDALVEILKEMENKDTVFIFAGYEEEMEEFIKMNPGLKSRIYSIIEFANYSLDELFEILIRKLAIHNLHLHQDAVEEVKFIINKEKSEKNFGNGRYINHLFDKILMNHAKNCKGSDDLDILSTISIDDLKDVEDKVKKKTIGFSA